jgi:hypothetical protein
MPLTPAPPDCKDRTVDLCPIHKLDLEISALRCLNICSQLQPKILAIESPQVVTFLSFQKCQRTLSDALDRIQKVAPHEYERATCLSTSEHTDFVVSDVRQPGYRLSYGMMEQLQSSEGCVRRSLRDSRSAS